LKPPVGQSERNLTERTLWILQAYSTYAAVSNNGFRYAYEDKTHEKPPIVADKENWGSLEDIHNSVHNICGGGGTMSAIAKSAFDPIFWLREYFLRGHEKHWLT
jgi:tyrosinase